MWATLVSLLSIAVNELTLVNTCHLPSFLLSIEEDRPIHKRGGFQAISLLLLIELAPSLIPTQLKCLILIGISDKTEHVVRFRNRVAAVLRGQSTFSVICIL